MQTTSSRTETGTCGATATAALPSNWLLPTSVHVVPCGIQPERTSCRGVLPRIVCLSAWSQKAEACHQCFIVSFQILSFLVVCPRLSARGSPYCQMNDPGTSVLSPSHTLGLLPWDPFHVRRSWWVASFSPKRIYISTASLNLVVQIYQKFIIERVLKYDHH